MSSTATRMAGGATALQKCMMLLAASDDSPIRGTVRLQHMMFLASRIDESGIGDAGFRPGGRGPHSDAVEAELARLVDAGVFAPGDDIVLTAAGQEAAAELAGGVPAGWDGGLLGALCSYKSLVNELDCDEVQVFSYCAHPHMTLHGDEYRSLEPRTEQIVMGMAEAEKVTMGRAADLLQVPRGKVWDEMMRRGAVRLRR